MSAITPAPKLKRDSNPAPFQTSLAAFHLRIQVIQKVGKEYLDGFEMWAFKCETGMIYDRRIISLWNNVHSRTPLKYSVHEDAIEEIIEIWKKRFDQDEEGDGWPKNDFGD